MAYTTPQVPANVDIEGLRRFIGDELDKVAKALAETQALELRPVYREPDKPRPGMIVYADGTSWDPGSGEGPYAYNLANTWVALF